MTAWLKSLKDNIPDSIDSPSALAAFELSSFFKGTDIEMDIVPDMGDSWNADCSDRRIVFSGGEKGLLYAAYSLIRKKITGEAINELYSGSPAYSLRMLNCWDNMDGSVERGYSGRSLFFEGGRLKWNPVRLRQLGRLLASVGINCICVNNVNVHFPAQLLIKDMLPDLADLASLFRPFGIRIMVSVDFSQPVQNGVSTADPLDGEVRDWWFHTAEAVYSAIPDLAGFLVKADSENRPGPNTYGRTHAEGANMIAEALRPFGGVVVWRAFVYNCHQDWRDTGTDRPSAAWEIYQPLDGLFSENVILQIKYGPFDFQVREPVSPLLLSLKHTNISLELQLAQEYTGQQKDIFTMMPMWHEIYDDLRCSEISSIAAVSNLGRDDCITGHPLAAANLFCFGLLSWNPYTDVSASLKEWIKLTYSLNGSYEDKLLNILLRSRSIYEKYTSPLGLCWMVRPESHYGPSPSGYEFDIWGTYNKADRNSVGIDRTVSGTGYISQYPDWLRDRYSDPHTCPDRYLLFFHRLHYSWKMEDGRTLIQRIYDDHFEGAEEAEAMARELEQIPFPSPDREIILQRAEMQISNSREWRDVINTFFHRLSGINDEHGRKIYD